MPAPAGTKRVKGVQVHRPFVFGSLARPFNPTSNPRPNGVAPEHTHTWTLYLRPLSPEHDISHWLRKVQFKLHETYAHSTRIIESPGPFEVHETGWGEFEVQIKLFFVPEANEKAGTLWHALKLHPYGDEAMKEMQRERGEVRSECYEEVVFTEPVEGFFDILTREPGVTGTKGKGKGGKGARGGGAGPKLAAEVPLKETKECPYSLEREQLEMSRIRDAGRQVEGLMKGEKEALLQKEREREELGRKRDEELGKG